jgi:prepilin peptidase CpaA
MTLHSDQICLIGAAIVGIAGGLFDLRRCHRIPNLLTFPAIGAGILMRGILEGWHGAGSAALAALITFSVMAVLFFMNTLGAGDVKLMSAVAAFAAMPHVFFEMFWTAMAGGVIALVLIIAKRQFAKRIGNVFQIFLHHFHSGLVPHPEIHQDSPDALKFPYGTAIAAGSIAVLLLTRGTL